MSRRAQALRATLPVLRNAGEAGHLLVDSTGLKLFDEGDWKVRKHGCSNQRRWRKVHLGLDAETRQVCPVLMTHRDLDDSSVLPKLLAQIPPETSIEVVGSDGACNTMAAHTAIAGCERPGVHSCCGGGRALACPVKLGYKKRNQAIARIVQSGKQDWKDKSGYHRRFLVENLMYRFKTPISDRIWVRGVDVKDVEVAVRVDIISRRLVLARSKSVQVA